MGSYTYKKKHKKTICFTVIVEGQCQVMFIIDCFEQIILNLLCFFSKLLLAAKLNSEVNIEF